jgi:hypothetical protein
VFSSAFILIKARTEMPHDQPRSQRPQIIQTDT